MINEAMPGQALQPSKAFGHDADMKVPPFAGAGMAGVLGAVVAQAEREWRQFGTQPRLDFGGDRHGCLPLSSGSGRCLPR